MGIPHCNTQHPQIEGWNLIEKGMSNQFTSLDKKVYEEYENLKQLIKINYNKKDASPKNSFFILTPYKKQFSRFVKWYKIAYYDPLIQSTKKKMSLRKIVHHQTSFSNKEIKHRRIYTDANQINNVKANEYYDNLINDYNLNNDEEKTYSKNPFKLADINNINKLNNINTIYNKEHEETTSGKDNNLYSSKITLNFYDVDYKRKNSYHKTNSIASYYETSNSDNIEKNNLNINQAIKIDDVEDNIDNNDNSDLICLKNALESQGIPKLNKYINNNNGVLLERNVEKLIYSPTKSPERKKPHYNNANYNNNYLNVNSLNLSQSDSKTNKNNLGSKHLISNNNKDFINLSNTNNTGDNKQNKDELELSNNMMKKNNNIFKLNDKLNDNQLKKPNTISNTNLNSLNIIEDANSKIENIILNNINVAKKRSSNNISNSKDIDLNQESREFTMPIIKRSSKHHKTVQTILKPNVFKKISTSKTIRFDLSLSQVANNSNNANYYNKNIVQQDNSRIIPNIGNYSQNANNIRVLTNSHIQNKQTTNSNQESKGSSNKNNIYKKNSNYSIKIINTPVKSSKSSKNSSFCLNKEAEFSIRRNNSLSGKNRDFSQIVYQNIIDFQVKFPVKFNEKLAKGVPNSLRWLIWMVAGNLPIRKLENNYLSYYHEDLDEKIDLQIKKDLKRTITDESLFEINDVTNNSLYKVLRAFANNDKEVSYCQGMNFIAGFLLIVSDFNEIEVFYMMQSLFSTTFANHLGIRGFYTDSFPMLNFYLFLFDYFFKETFPKLYEHFISLNLPHDAWVSKWFMTLFTICMPIPVTTKIWDCLLTFGLNFLVQFTLSLLHNMEDTLYRIEDEFDLVEFFKLMTPFSTNTEIELNLDNVLKEATQIKMNSEIIKELRIQYEKENNIDLNLLDVKYEIRAFDSVSMSSCYSRVDFSHSEYSRDSVEIRSQNNSVINGKEHNMNLFYNNYIGNNLSANEGNLNYCYSGNSQNSVFNSNTKKPNHSNRESLKDLIRINYDESKLNNNTNNNSNTSKIVKNKTESKITELFSGNLPSKTNSNDNYTIVIDDLNYLDKDSEKIIKNNYISDVDNLRSNSITKISNSKDKANKLDNNLLSSELSSSTSSQKGSNNDCRNLIHNVNNSKEASKLTTITSNSTININNKNNKIVIKTHSPRSSKQLDNNKNRPKTILEINSDKPTISNSSTGDKSEDLIESTTLQYQTKQMKRKSCSVYSTITDSTIHDSNNSNSNIVKKSTTEHYETINEEDGEDDTNEVQYGNSIKVETPHSKIIKYNFVVSNDDITKLKRKKLASSMINKNP